MKTQLLLSISLTLKLIHGEAIENPSHHEEHETTTKSKPGLSDRIRKAADIIEKEIFDSLKPIVPGTKWCGIGNRSKSADDLGLFKLTDSCCREHDKCPDNIIAGKSRHGLKNSGLFTRSNCDCDEKFYDCLKKANNIVSTEVGIGYFNILRPKCFREEYPVLGCKERGGLLLTGCVKYDMNYSSPKIWQWFDAMEF